MNNKRSKGIIGMDDWMSEEIDIIFLYPWFNVLIPIGIGAFMGIVAMLNIFDPQIPLSNVFAIVDLFIFFFALYVAIWIDADYHRTVKKYVGEED